jgi:hypothetical protein
MRHHSPLCHHSRCPMHPRPCRCLHHNHTILTSPTVVHTFPGLATACSAMSSPSRIIVFFMGTPPRPHLSSSAPLQPYHRCSIMSWFPSRLYNPDLVVVHPCCAIILPPPVVLLNLTFTLAISTLISPFLTRPSSHHPHTSLA